LTYKYLRDAEELLLKRKVPLNDNNFYKFAAPRSIDEYKKSKIMIPDMLVKNRMGFDEDGMYYHGPAIHSIVFNEVVKDQNPILYLAILNSKLFWYFIKNTSTALQGNAFRLTPEYLNDFSFPEIDIKKQKNTYNNILKLVDMMYQLNEKLTKSQGNVLEQIKIQLNKTDDEINQYIYDLYDVSVEERKIIEEINNSI
jgi:adenine-specific DNA-methyltransferase